MEMLEVAAETFVGESGPGDELVHALGVLVPCVTVSEVHLIGWYRKVIYLKKMLDQGKW